MDVATYLRGVALLILALAPLGVAASRLRSRLTPGWSAAPGLLASAVLFLAMLLGVAQALGAVGWFRTAPVVGACALVGAVVALACGRLRPSDPADGTRPDPFGRWGAIVVVMIVGVVVGTWCARTATSVNGGILDFDSLNYHLPFAGAFVQHGHILPLRYTSPGSETPFDPANSELVHAFGMLVFRRDILSPFVNLGWLGLSMLAAWCVGRRWGLGPLTLVASAVLLASPLMVTADAGSAKNDIVDVCLLLAAVALLLHARRDDGRLELGAVAVAAAAAGIGLGNKLSIVVPVVALTVGVVAAAGGSRRRVAATWIGVLIATGSFWYVRNLVVVGNPVPSLKLGVGSLRLPSPDQSIVRRTGFSVAHYLTDGHAWRAFFLHGLKADLGLTWPLVLGFGAVGTVVATRARDRTLRWLGLAAAMSAVAYVFTPESAGGPPGHPGLFANNFRYAFPALGLALVVGAVAMAQRWPGRARTLFGLLALAVVGDQTHWLAHIDVTWGRALGPLLIGLAAVAVATLVALARPSVTFGRFAALAVVAIVALGLVRPFYFDRRYADVRHWGGNRHVRALGAVYTWANGVRHARIATAGLDEQYPLLGSDLSNEVRYIGRMTPHHGFERTTTCRAWRQAVVAGHFDYIVTAKDRAPGEPYEAGWTRGDPAVSEILHVASARVFRVHGVLDPRRCR